MVLAHLFVVFDSGDLYDVEEEKVKHESELDREPVDQAFFLVLCRLFFSVSVVESDWDCLREKCLAVTTIGGIQHR